jgi:hypothetical protein
MEWSYGNSSWDNYVNHIGDFCLYSGKFCQEGRCVDCQIYIDAKEKFDMLHAKLLKIDN